MKKQLFATFGTVFLFDAGANSAWPVRNPNSCQDKRLPEFSSFFRSVPFRQKFPDAGKRLAQFGAVHREGDADEIPVGRAAVGAAVDHRHLLRFQQGHGEFLPAHAGAGNIQQRIESRRDPRASEGR